MVRRADHTIFRAGENGVRFQAGGNGIRRPSQEDQPLGVGAHPGVAVAALVLAAGTAGTGVVAPDASEVVVPRWALAGLDVRSAVDGRGRVLQSLRLARGEPGR